MPVPALPSPLKAASHQVLDVLPPPVRKWMASTWKFRKLQKKIATVVLVMDFWEPARNFVQDKMSYWRRFMVTSLSCQRDAILATSPEMASVSVHVYFQSVTRLSPSIQGAKSVSGRVIYQYTHVATECPHCVDEFSFEDGKTWSCRCSEPNGV